MIIGFGNNVVSSLAADITANQTTMQVTPGTGARFAGLLTYDYANSSNILKTYAKITLTDAKETVFEVCHLISVSNDMLTVVRGQEGTTAKGWSLNDVIANFATRGSENQFVQIEQLQSGHYTAAVAGGTANALTLELPATYFLNGSTDWVLRSPVIVYPTQNNTGASTLQLTMGGRVLGTFPLYKGNKAALVANDILKDVALVCLMDNTKTFFNVANPGAIYAGLGTAAFRDAQTSVTDATAGRLMQVGAFGLGGATPEISKVNTLTELKAMGSGKYAVNAPSPDMPSIAVAYELDWSLTANSGNQYGILIAKALVDKGSVYDKVYRNALRNGVWQGWVMFYDQANKPTATDTGALPITGGTLTGPLSINNADFINKNGYTTYTDGGGKVHRQAGGMRLTIADTIFTELYYNETSGESAEVSLHNKYGSTDSYCSLRNDGQLSVIGVNPQVILSNGTIFATDGNVKGSVWDNGYLSNWILNKANDAKNSAIDWANTNCARKPTSSLQSAGWFRDATTGFITQWGILTRTGESTRVWFPVAFPNACVNVQLTLRNSNAGGSNANVFANGEDGQGFNYISGSNEIQSFWMAIGY
ncbi:gp53-like domain-containing protein [Serratia sp. N21D137]|uniref:gp53-like domain-containing protein n=1 Tax=Serratia sp. N21D137 TaxID=3397495 RepID=UPI0039E16730